MTRWTRARISMRLKSWRTGKTRRKWWDASTALMVAMDVGPTEFKRIVDGRQEPTEAQIRAMAEHAHIPVEWWSDVDATA